MTQSGRLIKLLVTLLAPTYLIMLPGWAVAATPEASLSPTLLDTEIEALPSTEDRPVVNGQPQAPQDYTKIYPEKLTYAEIAPLLGWTSAPASPLICKGYYTEPNLYYPLEKEVASANKAPIKISADQSLLSQSETSRLSGNVMVTQPDRSIASDLAYINRNPETLKPQSIDVYGKVILREPGKVAIANKGHFNLDDKSGTLSDVIYRMTFGELPAHIDQAVEEKLMNTNVNGWGIAQQVVREPTGVVVVKKGTYTACPPSSSVWHLIASKLTLNKETGRGEATNAALFVKDVPVFYTPYFSFPLDKRRKTGFLYPTFGHSTTSGYDIGIPFYWNIAPNYDATITPDIMSIRGLQLNGEFRYLSPKSTGNLHGSFLINDRAFREFQQDSLNDAVNELMPLNPTLTIPELKAHARKDNPQLNDLLNDSANRYFVSFKDTRFYNSNWSSYLYVNHVSDDYYFEDFDSDPAQITDNQILNEADLYFNSEHWHVTTQLQGYQTLQPFNQAFVANQYRKLPELMLVGQYPDLPADLNFQITNQFDNFYIDKNPNQLVASPDGNRLYINPDLSRPKYWAWGFFKPDAQLTVRQYDLKPQDIPNDLTSAELMSLNQLIFDDHNITSTIPIFDIDSGLFFDRDFSLFGRPLQQTFEPRLFYLYVPYHDQTDIPLFDTTVEPFTFSQLFRTNRFTGIDRIGDTNQLSLAATTRFINQETGDEKLRASIGQIYYFEDRRVFIYDEALDLVTFDNQVPNNALSSPIAAELNYYVNRDWSVMSDLAWDPNYHRTNNADVMFQYKKDNQHIVNVGYTFLRGGDAFVPPDGITTILPDSPKNNLNQADISAVWPLGHNWTALARWNYNFSHNYPQTYFGGLEYDACCWSFRTVIGRDFNYLDENNQPQFNHEIYFQIALKTLGSAAASSPSKLLDTIPGYVDEFGGGEHL